MFVAWPGLLILEFKSLMWGEVYILGSFCSAMTSLSRCLEEAAFSISISSTVFIFLWLFSAENVVLKTKGLQERNTQVLGGTTVKNR